MRASVTRLEWPGSDLPGGVGGSNSHDFELAFQIPPLGMDLMVVLHGERCRYWVVTRLVTGCVRARPVYVRRVCVDLLRLGV